LKIETSQGTVSRTDEAALAQGSERSSASRLQRHLDALKIETVIDRGVLSGLGGSRGISTP